MFAMPGPFSVVLLVVGILFLFSRFKKAGKIFLILGLIIIYAASSHPVSYFLVSFLERQYPALTEERLRSEDFSQVEYVVVLGSGSFYQKNIPMVSQHTPTQLIRLMTAYEIHRFLPHTKMILSGGGPGPLSEGEMMKNFLIFIGAPLHLLVVEGESENTWEQALHVKKIVGDGKVILVTSAVHMPRAMMLFHRVGFDPIAAPADIRYRNFSDKTYWALWPNARHLQASEAAWYEYLGLIKEKIKFLMPIK